MRTSDSRRIEKDNPMRSMKKPTPTADQVAVSICFLPRPTQAKFQRVVSRGNERGNNKLLSCCPIVARRNWLPRLRRMSPTDQSTFSPKRSPMPLRLTAHYFKFFIGMPVR